MNKKDDVDVVEQENVNHKSKFEALTTTIMVNYSLYSKFTKYLELRYSFDNELINKKRQEEVEHVFNVGLIHCMNDLNTTTSTTSLLYDGKPLRSDVLKNLAKIAMVAEADEHHPNFRQNRLNELVRLVLEKKDSRTLVKHLKCIVNASTKNYRSGTYDISNFCKAIPPQIYTEIQEDFDGLS